MIAIALIVPTYLMVKLPEWDVKTKDQLEFKGNQLIPTAKLKGILKLKLPQSIFFIDSKQIAEDLERSGLVTQVQAQRTLFPTRVSITLVERKPVAKVMIGNKLELIDADGKLMSPQFYPKPARDLKLLVKVSNRDYIQQNWRYIYREISTSGLDISSIDWRDPINLILVNPQLNAHCGYFVPTKFVRQIQKVRQFQTPQSVAKLNQYQTGGVRRINLSNPDNPFLF